MGCTKSHPVALPQNDDEKGSRRQELQQARSKYELEQKTFQLDGPQQQLVNIVNVPPMLKSIPSEEKRSCIDTLRFRWTFVRYEIYQYWGCALQWICQCLFRDSRWTIDDMVNQFSCPSLLKEPKGCQVWRKEAIDKDDQRQVSGFTHLLMDGVSVCMHRNLSSRHPIYKLLEPHFQYLHAINDDAINDLINPGGYVDRDMYFDRVHMLKLIATCTHNKNWTFNIDACIQTNLKKRGVMDLPGYFFRDDALMIHSAIRTFVEEYATHYYTNDQEVQLDKEIHGFREELIRQRTVAPGGGCGMNGLPDFTNIQNLVDVLTNFIYINSVEHSATNFPQYEQYGFPPNFPAMLRGLPEKGMTNLNINMPTKKEMLSTIKIMNVLILAFTNSLGNYEKVYLNEMDEAGRTFVQTFQKQLIEIETHINQRNADLVARNNPEQVQEYPYEWLRPKNVLNSISN